jgi:hypothetical protein
VKIVDGTCSFIIVGKWNKHILTPEWVGKKVFKAEQLEIQFPINQPDLAPRYKSSDNILFVPAVHRCQFTAQEPYDDEMLRKICRYAKDLVSTLQYTPVSGFGTNFVFEEKSENFKQLELFNLLENDKLKQKNYTAKIIEIKRQFSLAENNFLNFGISYTQDRIVFDFNFHYNAANPSEIAALTTENLFIENKKRALDLMKDIYDLELDSYEEGDQ